ncbi:hypothetical protein COV81_02675 [Candidatus Peregrinibacteria bacterium CG11_big_fil_rev_8_21_14_0_20_41_10]|nr:MAG: hypothetical protein COV81_02675 [Candidatus Peregrinibacteria bacterium CG11_big_fil_rev_8_21_14_0_20_41_10]PIZ76560.1 MAG: hypothetical protein COY06_01680 [Candidatus Peregrinibacteria bacterium CG_4_10_14_0_2_um_filter_41_8]PJC37646.1 MAG: hypothetical protein CO045_04090 [Candidatus Peregrinibacteria bacterium CG_4_9_14_0_2_um_filter_41_14]
MAEENTQGGTGKDGAPQGNPARNYQVHINEDNRAGVYANAVSVHVNRNEVVLDFGYIQPGQQQGQNRIDVISRVNLNHQVARSFMTLLQDAILDFQNRVKEADGAQASDTQPQQ